MSYVTWRGHWPKAALKRKHSLREKAAATAYHICFRRWSLAAPSSPPLPLPLNLELQLLLRLFVCSAAHKSAGSSGYKLTADKFGQPLDAALICQDIRSFSSSSGDLSASQIDAPAAVASCRKKLVAARSEAWSAAIRTQISVAARKFVLTKCWSQVLGCFNCPSRASGWGSRWVGSPDRLVTLFLLLLLLLFPACMMKCSLAWVACRSAKQQHPRHNKLQALLTWSA